MWGCIRSGYQSGISNMAVTRSGTRTRKLAHGLTSIPHNTQPHSHTSQTTCLKLQIQTETWLLVIENTYSENKLTAKEYSGWWRRWYKVCARFKYGLFIYLPSAKHKGLKWGDLTPVVYCASFHHNPVDIHPLTVDDETHMFQKTCPSGPHQSTVCAPPLTGPDSRQV